MTGIQDHSKDDFYKQRAQYEMNAAGVGIKKGETLYKENCLDCEK